MSAVCVNEILPSLIQNSDFLAQKLTHLNRDNFKDLSPVGLSNLVATFPGLDPMVARKIADHDIDGEAFLMLTQKVRHVLNLQLT